MPNLNMKCQLLEIFQGQYHDLMEFLGQHQHTGAGSCLRLGGGGSCDPDWEVGLAMTCLDQNELPPAGLRICYFMFDHGKQSCLTLVVNNHGKQSSKLDINWFVDV